MEKIIKIGIEMKIIFKKKIDNFHFNSINNAKIELISFELPDKFYTIETVYFMMKIINKGIKR